MYLEKISSEMAVDLIALINSCKGIKYNKKVSITTKTGKDLSYEYTTLDKIYAHVKSDKNFALLEPLGTNGSGQPAVQIILVHRSGEAITSDYYALNLPHNGSKQDEGSAITYTKRYALGSFLGISTDGDNDANPDGKGMPIINYREEYKKACAEKGIDSSQYAIEHGINKKTTQAQFKEFVEQIRSMHEDVIEQDEPTETISFDEL